MVLSVGEAIRRARSRAVGRTCTAHPLRLGRGRWPSEPAPPTTRRPPAPLASVRGWLHQVLGLRWLARARRRIGLERPGLFGWCSHRPLDRPGGAGHKLAKALGECRRPLALAQWRALAQEAHDQ